MSVLVDQLEFYWEAHLWPRLDGLTDEEYHWAPVAGCWDVRPDAQGRFVPDGIGARPQGLAPFTTIAWRLAHIAVGCFHTRVSTFFPDRRASATALAGAAGGGSAGAPAEVPVDADMFDPRHIPALPGTAADALAFLEDGYRRWHDAVAELDEAALARPLGPRGGPYANDSMAALLAHVNRELMHHGGELGVLRDLYARRAEFTRP